MRRSPDEILDVPKGKEPRIYAWSTTGLPKYEGCLKVGRIKQSKGQANYDHKVEVNELAARDDGSFITDHQVRARLVKKGLENVELEWMRCTAQDVLNVIAELRAGVSYEGSHHLAFPMRVEQADAVERTAA